MRIVVDLQGAQSTGSRPRGIGRYSLALAKAMAADARGHEIWIALSGLFPDAIEPIRASLDGLVPQDRIVIWHAPAAVANLDPSGRWRTTTGELAREAFLSSLKPDVLHVSSLFEGLGDDTLTSIGSLPSTFPTAMTLYDLIPLINRETYLADKVVESWYERKLGHLRRAHLWLAISESSRGEAIDWLDLPDECVVNISTAADSMFRPRAFDDDTRSTIRHRYGLTRPFVMYTGGIDRRKNVERLISSYAQLPPAVRATHQLAVVCAATTEQMAQLKRLARQNRLERDELVLTGFVADEDLVALYNLCKVFIFPSWHEGFGLPALEAMSCGAPVIGADTSSVPEVLGRSDALFSPFVESDMVAKLNAVLTDDTFRQQLKDHALPQAAKFSWARTGRSALEAMERVYARRVPPVSHRLTVVRPRPRLAYVSPMPPERSGIADYSAELLPELARHYDIDVIVNQTAVDDPWIRANLHVRSVQWFDKNARLFDRVLYHLGNSSFHAHMFELLDRHAGTVVLHDFFLSGVLAHMEWVGYAPGAWTQALYSSHGYYAASERSMAESPSDETWKDLVGKYPANLAVLNHANGVIVHSEFSRALATKWYGDGCADDWICIPLARRHRFVPSRDEARRMLDYSEEDFVVCCFGMMGPTKLNHRLLGAWLESPMGRSSHCHLVFVGENEGGEYGASILRMIKGANTPKSITVTGFARPETYQSYLAAADAAVQLRAMSRGETSAAILDCMSRGLPTIVNGLGAANELPADCVYRLPADFSDGTLAAALETLWRQPALRQTLGGRASAHARKYHHPRDVGDEYHDAIEDFSLNGPRARAKRLIAAIAGVDGPNSAVDADWLNLARCIAQNSTREVRGLRQWLLDISTLVRSASSPDRSSVEIDVMRPWLTQPPAGFRFEPVYCDDDGLFRYARGYTSELLRINAKISPDDPIDARPGDVFISLEPYLDQLPTRREFYESMRKIGVRQFCIMNDSLLARDTSTDLPGDAFEGLLTAFLAVTDGVLCSSPGVASELAACIDALRPQRHRILRIGCLSSTDKGVDRTLDAVQLAEIILDDRWRWSWHPSFGIAPWDATTTAHLLNRAPGSIGEDGALKTNSLSGSVGGRTAPSIGLPAR